MGWEVTLAAKFKDVSGAETGTGSANLDMGIKYCWIWDSQIPRNSTQLEYTIYGELGMEHWVTFFTSCHEKCSTVVLEHDSVFDIEGSLQIPPGAVYVRIHAACSYALRMPGLVKGYYTLGEKEHPGFSVGQLNSDDVRASLKRWYWRDDDSDDDDSDED
ncbi:hypothetical protein [Largemouth bass virus]|uniref:Uncharacterized protein n=1 Tax=Largemouth bass virus TaxID=176656 RepID=A0A9E7PPC9_9VIRU|nr:hypothetical protein [Mandarin fish ranavirus]UUY86217.1 hypothetical protein [Largemouth bass virus]WEI29055.1 hypothetical protein [Largemouth bass virus]WEI29057.1 hypothetical protein [Largemouth bass virus]WHA35623.1 hypothetical protein SCRaV_30R [Siniperca chuatsi ranavirus]